MFAFSLEALVSTETLWLEPRGLEMNGRDTHGHSHLDCEECQMVPDDNRMRFYRICSLTPRPQIRDTPMSNEMFLLSFAKGILSALPGMG